MSDWMGYYNLAPDRSKSERDVLSAIFQAARDRGTGNTGMFGLRLQGHSFDYFIRKLRVLEPDRSNDHERIQVVFGRTLFVHLTRQNKLDQSISYVKASQTGLWHRASGGLELERLTTAQEAVYNANAIQRHLTDLVAMDERWISWFAKEGLTPLRINYEELSEDPIAVTGKLLEELGVSRELATGLEIPVEKLADATNTQWASQFEAMTVPRRNFGK